MVAFQLSDKKEASRNLAPCWKLIILALLLLHVVHAQDEVPHQPPHHVLGNSPLQFNGI